ncbi:MAG: sialate O-acetylesterase [Bacteroides sp.]|nr:sialate O-acetylesterase [Bacteroides sp.]
MNNKVKLVMGALLYLCSAIHAEAKVKLPSLISDGMVLQREQPVKVWGTADAGEKIEIRLFKEKRMKGTYHTMADANGQWSVQLPPTQAGGPYRMQINDMEVKDVLFGDVYLCSGQSNMELPVRRVTDMFADEIAAYNNENIRHFIVPKTFNFHTPQTDLPEAEWETLNQQNVMDFSALAYFTAKALYEKNGIPVGLINASWGGTPVEAWMSEESLKPFPKYINDKRLYEDDAYCRKIKEVEGQDFYRWNLTLYKGDPGKQAPVQWSDASYDDRSWQTVDMLQDAWGSDRQKGMAGSHWLRKSVEIPTTWEGKEAVLRLGCIVDADSVYVNGTFVGTTGYQYPPRIYPIPAGILKAGENNVTVRVISNGGQPHFVPEKPYKIICENEEVSLEGDWKYRQGAPMPNAPGMMFFCYKPICLYNAMIAPLANYALKGAIWYQGESNVDKRDEYANLLGILIKDWRDTFHNDTLPFYIVELADFLHPSDIDGRKAWAEMRIEQAKAAENTPHAWLIRNGDLGEWNDIHPLDKKTLGNRVAEKILDNNQ